MSKTNHNKRKTGCAEIGSNHHTAMKTAKWYVTTDVEIENADGTMSIKKQKQQVTDPAKKAVFDDFARSILDICTHDPKTGHFHVFRSYGGANKWSECGKTSAAIAFVYQELSQHQHHPTKEFITDVLSRPELFPFCGGDDMAPFAGPTFIRDGIMYRNTFRDSGVPFDPTPITDDEKAILTDLMGGIIRTNLCNLRGDKTFDELVAIIHDTKNDAEFPFRYLMHNIAVNYMRPGFNIRTNLALVGQPGGMGKSYINQIMKRMLGFDMVISPSDPTSKFNDWMVGSSLVVWNEIEDCTYDKTFNTMVKRVTIDSTVSINKKQATQRAIPNMINHWFFSNQLMPYKLDATDRRTIFIRTFNGSLEECDARKEFADSFSTAHDDSDIARIFAKFLHTMVLDFDVLKYRQTEVAKDAIEQSATLFEEFMREESLAGLYSTDPSRDTKTRKYITLRMMDLVDAYKAWCANNNLKTPRRSEVDMGLKNMPGCFTKLNGRWFVEPGLSKFRNGTPMNVSLDTHIASQSSYQAQVTAQASNTQQPTTPTPQAIQKPISTASTPSQTTPSTPTTVIDTKPDTKPTDESTTPPNVNTNANTDASMKKLRGQELVDEIKRKRGLQ